MWKLIVIAVIALYLIRSTLRILQQPAAVTPPETKELKACAYCDMIMRADKGYTTRGYFFCSTAHAKRFFDEGRHDHA